MQNKMARMKIAIDYTKLMKLWWFLCDRCEECGGELDIWDAKHDTCTQCGRYR
jgi:hypothetical protein